MRAYADYSASREPIARGVAIGTASHAIGTARAMEMGEVEGAMSSLSIAVAGLLTVAFASVFSFFGKETAYLRAKDRILTRKYLGGVDHMKEIKLKADKPFHNNVDVAVIDFPDGPEGEERQRCKVTVEFAESDVKQLQDRGLDFDGAMEYYRDWLDKVVRCTWRRNGSA